MVKEHPHTGDDRRLLDQDGVVRDESVALVTADTEGGFLLWWVVEGQVRASTRVVALGAQATV